MEATGGFELSWSYIEQGFPDVSDVDLIFRNILNEVGGSFANVEINGKWTILGELSPLDVKHF
jgi:hypothetical protein